jgi:hypothetical protein
MPPVFQQKERGEFAASLDTRRLINFKKKD